MSTKMATTTHSVDISWVEFCGLLEEKQAGMGVYYILDDKDIDYNSDNDDADEDVGDDNLLKTILKNN